MRGEQITTGKLTGLKMHCNANYATKERKRLKSMGSTPRQVDQNPSASTHLSSTLRYLSRIEHLAGIKKPHPKCKPKETDNCIKRTLCKVNNPCNHGYKHRCCPLVAIAHPYTHVFVTQASHRGA